MPDFVNVKFSHPKTLIRLVRVFYTHFCFRDPNKQLTIPNIAENLTKLWPAFNSRNELSLKLCMHSFPLYFISRVAIYYNTVDDNLVMFGIVLLLFFCGYFP